MPVSTSRRGGVRRGTVPKAHREAAEDMHAVVRRVDELLELRYRSADLGNKTDPLDEAIYIMLSVQTRGQVYETIYDRLRERFPTWQEVLAAPRRELQEVLRPAGFGAIRSATIKQFLGAVAQECESRGMAPGTLTLGWLAELDDIQAERVLCTLPGLSVKTARCVLAYCFGRDLFAVDTHVRRIFHRLGLVEVDNWDRKPDHALYDAIVPRGIRRRFHINLIHHGRKVCRSGTPNCSNCTLVSFCEIGRKTVAKDSRATAIDLFGGAGGLGKGFRDAGFRIALAVEQDREAAQTYRANHPGTPVHEGDVAELTDAQVRELAGGLENLAAVIAGPPCQGYSTGGHRDPDHHLNTLYQDVIRLSRALEARFVVIENVRGMDGVTGVDFVQQVLASLRNAEYEAEAHLLWACDFGVPQRRQRYFYLGQKEGLSGAPPKPCPTHCSAHTDLCTCDLEPTPTVLDVLASLPPLGPGMDAEYWVEETAKGTRIVLNGSTMHHGNSVVAKIANIEQGKGPFSYRRLTGDLARTLVAGHRALPVHPTLHRTISVREAARIQAFEDDYVFAGVRANQPLQVANAVPPPMAKAVARVLLHLLAEAGGPRRRRRRSRTDLVTSAGQHRYAPSQVY
jgi:DNA (cytosine-5)-methyltransferase 1